MKAVICLALILSASFAQAGVIFSGTSPLPQELRQKITKALTEKCQISPFIVSETQTLVRDHDDDGVKIRFYSSLFAVITPNRQIYANINVLSGNNEVVSLQSPLCR